MPTTLDITVPYNGGTIGSVTGNAQAQGYGNHYTWIGGNNGKKFVSVRIQNNPDFFVVNVFEVDDLQSSDMQITTLSSEAFPETASSNSYTTHIRMCRLNATTAFLKVITANSGSKNYVIEVDETDNSVTLHDATFTNQPTRTIANGSVLTDAYYGYNYGGIYDYTGSSLETGGRTPAALFVHQIKENAIVSMEHNSFQHFGGYTFVEKTWDPSTKVLFSRRIVTGNGQNNGSYNNTANNALHQDLDAGGTRLDHYYVNGSSSQEMKIFYEANGGGTHHIYSMFPRATLHGVANDRPDSSYSGNGYNSYVNVVEGRDGKLHFSYCYSTNTNWQSEFNSQTDNSWYCVTYAPDTDYWTLTGRRWNYGHSLGNGRDDMNIWLPLNTVNAKDYATQEGKLSQGDIDLIPDDQLYALTWIRVGAKSVKVVGKEQGSEIVISNSSNSNDEAVQAMWLDEDHFIVFYIDNMSNNNTCNVQNNFKYSVVRYYDEHYMETVSEGSINPSEYWGYPGQPPFRKVDDYTLVSDAFDKVITFWAPEQS